MPYRVGQLPPQKGRAEPLRFSGLEGIQHSAFHELEAGASVETLSGGSTLAGVYHVGQLVNRQPLPIVAGDCLRAHCQHGEKASRKP